MSEHHPHHHHNNEIQPIISRRWQVATIVGNAVVGAAEIAGGLAASAYSVVADGMHNGADVYTYWLQSKNLLQRHKLSQEKQQRNRKIAHWVLCATSVGVAAKAGVDLAMDKESVHNNINIYTSAASVAFNGLLFTGLYRGIRRRKQASGQGMDHLEKDITKHFALSDMPSAALALGGAYLHSKGMVDAEQWAAIASGTLSAAVFRPTKNNLAHDHDHFGEAEHDHSSDHHEHPQRISGLKRAINKVKQLKPNFVLNNSERDKKPRRRRAAAALTSLAIIGGLMGESIAREAQETTSITAQHNLFKTETERIIISRSEIVDTYNCVEVESGDSLWGMAAKQVNQALDESASSGQTNVVSLLAAHQTELANPDLLQVGECVEIPSPDAIESLFANPDLATDVNTLNRLSWDQVFTEEQLFDGINHKLEQDVAT